MNNEFEPMLSGIPDISKKTSNEQLLVWSKQHWPSDRRRYVAYDIVNNGKELLLGSDVDWDSVLGSIRVAREYNGSVQSGEVAIAANGARFIGGLAARAGWSMHDPQSVYLSGQYLAHIAGSELQDFKTAMTLSSVCYIRKTFPEDELLMKTLDLLSGHRDGRNNGNLVTRIATLLHDGNIQDAYSVVSSREDVVRRRGPDFSRTTKSSILTPPKFGT